MPGRFLAVMSASCALIDIVTAGVCSGMNLIDAGRQVLGERAVDHADQPVVDGDRCAGVAGLTAHLVDDRARLLARAPRDTARVAGGAAQLAGDVAESRGPGRGRRSGSR